MNDDARAATLGLIEQLRGEHPGESQDQLLIRSNWLQIPGLREAACVEFLLCFAKTLLDHFA
jgi:hypothetical protein